MSEHLKPVKVDDIETKIISDGQVPECQAFPRSMISANLGTPGS